MLCCGFRLANDYIVFDLYKTGISKLDSFIQLGIFDLIVILIILQKNVVLEEVVLVDEAVVDQVQGAEAFNEVVVAEDVVHREGDEEVDSEAVSEAGLVEGVASVVASAVAVDEGEVVVVVVVEVVVMECRAQRSHVLKKTATWRLSRPVRDPRVPRPVGGLIRICHLSVGK